MTFIGSDISKITFYYLASTVPNANRLALYGIVFCLSVNIVFFLVSTNLLVNTLLFCGDRNSFKLLRQQKLKVFLVCL